MDSCRSHVMAMIVLCAVGVPPLHATPAESLQIIGHVVDGRARPVGGARILLCDEAMDRMLDRKVLTELAETTSLPDGRFHLTTEAREGIFSGIRWLVAYKEGLALSWTTEGLGVRDITLVLGEPRLLGGVLVDEAGRPVVGAKVGLCLKNEMMERRELPLPRSADWLTRCTDSEGRFRFDAVPPDTTADFQIEAPERAPVWTFGAFGLAPGEQYPAGRTDLRVVLPPEARIEGRVVDDGTDKAVSDMHILARPHEQALADYCPAPASVDSEGRFALAGLTPGRYRLQAIPRAGTPQEWFGESAVLTVRAGQTVRDVTLGVNTGATLEVLVHEPDRDAVIEAVQVTVFSGTFLATATSGADGVARLHVPAGKYNIQGFKSGCGFTYPPREVQLERGQTQLEELRLAVRPVDVAGAVVDPQGHAVPGASVFHWPFWPVAPTDPAGRFAHRYYTTASRTRQTLLVRHESSGRACLAELAATGARRIEGQVTLRPAYALTGCVTDPNGTGIPAAYVRLLVCSPQRTGMVAEVVTDSHGVYRIHAVPPPPVNDDTPHYAVVARAPDYNEASVEPVPLGGPVEEPIRLETIVLQRADRTVAGVVVDANDRPVPGVLVETPHLGDSSGRDDAAQPHRRVLSDDQGRFDLRGVCQGPVEITARSPQPGSNLHGATYTRGGESGIKVVLGRTLTFAKSSVGMRSPDWDQLDLSGRASELAGKTVLLCFVDIQQRPCRHVLAQLQRESRELAEQGIAVVGIQTAVSTPADLREWAARELNALPLVCPVGNPEDLRQLWGVQSLPWLVLLDEDRVIRAAGIPARILPLQKLHSR